MSLRAFHLLFITLSIALCLFVAWWAWARAESLGGTARGTVVAAALLAAAGLGWYEILFQRKTRSLT
jgi:drug/metabolite transporter (DMT)-like permease